MFQLNCHLVGVFSLDESGRALRKHEEEEEEEEEEEDKKKRKIKKMMKKKRKINSLYFPGVLAQCDLCISDSPMFSSISRLHSQNGVQKGQEFWIKEPETL